MIRVNFYREKISHKNTLELSGNYPETTQKIIKLIKINSSITRKELSKEIGITKSGIKCGLKKCKEKEFLKELVRTREDIGKF